MNLKQPEPVTESGPSATMATGESTSSTQNANKRLKAVHVGISGFPFGSAAINKCLAVYESVHKHNVDFLIINNRAVHKKNVPVPIRKSGQVQNLRYCYTSLTPYKSDSFLTRRVSNFTGRIMEFFLLIRLCARQEVDVMFYYPTNGSFFELIYYRIFSRAFGFPLIAQYVEYRTAFKSEFKIHEKIKHYLFDKYFMLFVDAVLPISEYLIAHLRSRGYTKAMIKVPPLVDFSLFRKETRAPEEEYFLYVGSAAYIDAIRFIAESFDLARNSGFYLYMLVNGDPSQMNQVRKIIAELKKRDRVRLFSNLTYDDLVQKYLQAKGLLIPLTDSVQDRARFPQKISEYLASGNPVVTTNFGEVPFYFRDQENALIAQRYDATEFASKLDYIIENAQRSREIGLCGQRTGEKYFDFNSYGSEITKLILSLR
jgi:glycosyltransferase involved in cell wall biosynthesis